jgi:hypothetical protein
VAYLGMPQPDVYREAIRSGLAVWYTVDATRDGAPVDGATGLQPTGGTITDTTRPGVRRVLNLTLAPEPGLFDVLAPTGTQLAVTAHVRYITRTVTHIPMGVFDVDTQSLTEGGGGLTVTAPDKWVRIQRARFVKPAESAPGTRVTEQIAILIRGALGASEQVNITATSTAQVGALLWEADRAQAILDLARDIGAWVYFDRDGVATIADQPRTGKTADWLIDASASGVLTELDRERSRTATRNVVVVSSSASDGERFPAQTVWDNDPASPTYAGTDPLTAPETAGPFGISTYFYDTPTLATVAQARTAGLTILARMSGLASQVSLGAVPNPAVDAFDAIDVMPPRERYDLPRVIERHFADTVTHPLTVGQAQQIDGRSTRTEEIDGGS